MKNTLVIVFAIVFGLVLPAAGQEKKETEQTRAAASKEKAAPADANESPLVRAARESKARRQDGKSRITITNEDVKKSEGKLIQSTTKPLEPLPSSAPTAEEMRQVAAESARKAKREDLQAAVEKHQKTVNDLEKELRRIEETYYNEDDPDYREDVLANNFQETKNQLEAARKELAEARRALSATPKK